MNTSKRDGVFLGLVLTVGCLQILGWAVDEPVAQTIGQATVSSPFPVFFASQDVAAAPSQKVTLEVRQEGHVKTLTLDAQRCHLLSGAYLRRNAYKTMLAEAPFLEKEMPEVLAAALEYSLCEPGGLLTECDIPTPFDAIVVESHTASPSASVWRKEVVCP